MSSTFDFNAKMCKTTTELSLCLVFSAQDSALDTLTHVKIVDFPTKEFHLDFYSVIWNIESFSELQSLSVCAHSGFVC